MQFSHVLLIIFSGLLLICLGILAQALPSVTTAEEGREVREGILCEEREQWGVGRGKRFADMRVQLIDKRRVERNGGVRQMCT